MGPWALGFEFNPETLDLPVRRVAVTVPPSDWFHGIARAMHDIYRQGLVDLGLSVFDVPVEPFVSVEPARIAALMEEVRAFRPEMAFGSPKGSYALLCRLPPRRSGWRPNLFTDVLDIPTICYWDHAPLELADQLLAPLPDHPAHSAPGALDELRRALTHPRLVHWSRDDGQTAIMRELGLLSASRVVREMPSAMPGFSAEDVPDPVSDDARPGVGFVGHVYQEPYEYPDPELAAVAEEAIRSWAGTATPSLWEVLANRMRAVPADTRRRLAIDHDDTFFWRFAHRLILHRAQTAVRLRTIGGAGVPVTCYGNVSEGGPGTAGNLRPVPGHIPFGPALAGTLARHAVTIDVLSPGSIHGYSHKPILGFAAGGFVLVNRKAHFLEAFGDVGEAVSYGTAEELAGKVERFLAKPRERREVGDAMRERIAGRFGLHQVLARVMRAAAVIGDASTAGRAPSTMAEVADTVTVREDLLPLLRCEGHWDASVIHEDAGAIVTTPPDPWAYAAQIDVPEAGGLQEPHLRIDMQVDAGRVGIAAARGLTGALMGEQMIAATASAVSLVVELPCDEAAAVILRNAGEGTSRVRVAHIRLCNRVVIGTP